MTKEELEEAQTKVRRVIEKFNEDVEQLRSKGQMTPEAEAQVAEILSRLEPLVALAS
jgi:F0F1-type ATP synthase membrane subunit b/b'